jgi:hypothetical protein
MKICISLPRMKKKKATQLTTTNSGSILLLGENFHLFFVFQPKKIGNFFLDNFIILIYLTNIFLYHRIGKK